MADLNNFSVTPGSVASINTLDYVIAGTFTDSSTGQPIPQADFTGENAQHFPFCLNLLTEEQRRSVVDGVAAQVLRMRAGLE